MAIEFSGLSVGIKVYIKGQSNSEYWTSLNLSFFVIIYIYKYIQGFACLAILGRDPRAFLIEKISDVNPEFGKISKHSKLTIFSKLT